MTSADLLITNGTILTMDAHGTRIRNGAVAVTAGKLQSIGPADTRASWHAKQHIDADGGIIMPGLVNTHTHLPMTIFRGQLVALGVLLGIALLASSSLIYLNRHRELTQLVAERTHDLETLTDALEQGVVQRTSELEHERAQLKTILTQAGVL